jgi:protein gp37
VPDSFIDRVFAIMALAPRHTFQVLTKRAERMRVYLSDQSRLLRIVDACNQAPDGSEAVSGVTPNLTALARGVRRDPHLMQWPLMNVWLGVSAENQHDADGRIPLLLETPAAVRFLSCEPLLEAVDLAHYIVPDGANRGADPRQRRGTAGPNTHGDPTYLPDHELHWVMVGRERGAGARPFDLAWARSIVAQCQAAGVPVFVKQLGADAGRDPRAQNGGDAGAPLGPMVDESNGGDMSEWPEDLRVRQLPEAGASRVGNPSRQYVHPFRSFAV